MVETNSKKWWNEKQSLTSIYQIRQIFKEQEMVDHIANSFCHGSNDIFLLNFSPLEFASVPDQYIICPNEVNDALLHLKVHKAHGPDSVTNWLPKSNAAILCCPLTSILNASIAQG